MRSSFIVALLLVVSCVSAQNIGRDLSKVLTLVPDVKGASGDSARQDALDETICLLAYYAGMPDINRVYELSSGPELLEHYAGNAAMREFFLRVGIAADIEDHYVEFPDPYLEPLFDQQRSRFLEDKKGSDLFSQPGQIDLEQIRQSVTAPEAAPFSLAAVSKAAADRNADLSPNAMVSNALAGLSDFIAKRAQQELTYTFLDRLREYLQKNDLNYLFPETSGYLPDLDLLNYKAILPSIRRAFLQDLHALSFNLGNFLEVRDTSGFQNPAVYNIFLVYRILDLEFRDVPLPDILSFTYGELKRTRNALRSEIDLRIAAEQGASPAYQTLTSAFGAYAGAVQELNSNFTAAIDQTTGEVEAALDLLDAADLPEEDFDALLGQVDAVFLTVGGAGMPLAQNQRTASASSTNHQIVTSWLRGEEAYKYYESYPSLTKFDEFFGPDAEPFDATKRRAAGLRAVREILAKEQLLNVYRDQLDLINDSRIRISKISELISDAQQRAQFLNKPTEVLQQEIGGRIDQQLAVAPHPALSLLKSLTLDVPAKRETAYEHLFAVQERLDVWLAKNRPGEVGNRLSRNLGRKGLTGFDELAASIEATALAYQGLRSALVAFNNQQAGGKLYDSYQNVTTFETVFGVAQQSFFLLANSGTRLFLDKKEMSVFQTDAAARQLFSGISSERISRVSNLGKINGAGLVDFLLNFSLYLSDYQQSGALDQKTGPDDRRLSRTAAIEFITTSLEALLTAPILQRTSFVLDDENLTESLSERYTAFAKVPAVNTELKELFRLSQEGNYRYAIDNLLNLFQLLDVFPEASKKKAKLEERRTQLVEKRTALLGPLADDDAYVFDEEQDLAVIDPDLVSPESEEVVAGITPYVSPPPPFLLDTARLLELDQKISLVNARLDRINPKANQRFQENLFKYGTFMSDVVGANSADDIQTALDNIALPPGSSQIKRNRISSLELGAYFGAAFANEKLVLPVDEADRSLEDPALAVSLFVPVGLSYSRNIGGAKSLTLFASVLDLGAITSFRLDQRNEEPGASSVDRLPEFTFSNVVAPGLHLMYNFPRSPFTLGFGLQDGPNVREYTPAGSLETREARSVRFMITGSVDVPIFRFGGD